MAIRTVITRGYGNGTYNGTIPDVVRRGYSQGAAPAPTAPKHEGFRRNVGKMMK